MVSRFPGQGSPDFRPGRQSGLNLPGPNLPGPNLPGFGKNALERKIARGHVFPFVENFQFLERILGRNSRKVEI